MTLTASTPTNKVFQIFLILICTNKIDLRESSWLKLRHKKVYTCTLLQTAIYHNKMTARLWVHQLKQMKFALAAWPSKMLHRLILVKYTPIIPKWPLNEKLINFNTLLTNNKSNKSTKHWMHSKISITIRLVPKYHWLPSKRHHHNLSVFRNLTKKIQSQICTILIIKTKSPRSKLYPSHKRNFKTLTIL